MPKDSLKEVLGLWFGRNETAAFWMSVLTDMKAIVVLDILITATNNLNGFTDTINAVSPQSVTPICIVHQIRNATRYTIGKNKKEFTKDMKETYNTPTKDAAKQALNNFAAKWNSKYSYTIKNWENN